MQVGQCYTASSAISSRYPLIFELATAVHHKWLTMAKASANMLRISGEYICRFITLHETNTCGTNTAAPSLCPMGARSVAENYLERACCGFCYVIADERDGRSDRCEQWGDAAGPGGDAAWDGAIFDDDAHGGGY